MHLILATVAMVLILLVIITIVLYPQYSNKEPKATFISSNPFSLSIITDNNIDIENYTNIWGYTLNDLSSEYILYLNDPISKINNNKGFGHIISMAGNSDYIIFNDSLSFITRNKNFKTKDIVYKLFSEDSTISSSKLTKLLNSGFPYRTKRGIILHRAYLDNIIHSLNIPFDDVNIIPSYIEPRNSSSQITTSKIPKIIHQTFESKALPARLINAINTWIIKNPEYEYRYYDNGDRRDFIKRNFDSKVLAAYDKLVPGAYKADLWRYCVMYIVGGVYIDIKMGDIVPLNKIIDDDTSMVLVNDDPDDSIYNAFFATFPRNPLIYNVINSVVENIENNYYGISPLYPTGPVAMGKSIIPELNYEKHLPLGKTLTNYGYIQVYSFKHIDGGGRIGIDNQPPLILTRNTPDTHDQPFLYRITGNENYGVLWNKTQIYYN